MIAESKVEQQLEKELTRATKLVEKQVDADAKQLEKELNQAAAGQA